MDLVVDEPTWCMDILPTLSNLFGVEYDSRLLIGRDVFSEQTPLVFWPMTYSWKTDKGLYNGNKGTFTPVEGVEVPEGYVDEISAAVRNKVMYSRGVQWYNYYGEIAEALGLNEETP